MTGSTTANIIPSKSNPRKIGTMGNPLALLVAVGVGVGTGVGVGGIGVGVGGAGVGVAAAGVAWAIAEFKPEGEAATASEANNVRSSPARTNPSPTAIR